MTTQGVLLKVRMTGGPPWGLRFMGGQGTPICISKIRRKSKAFNANLQEGDEVLSVNGRNVRNGACDIAMGYVDAAVDTLDLELVRRGSGAPTMPINASSTEHMNGNTEIRRVPTYQITTSQKPRQPGHAGHKQTSTTTHVQTRTDGGVREETITKTITERIGEEAKTTTKRDVKTYGAPQDTTDSTGTGRQGRGSAVTFHAPKINVAAKPEIWSPPGKSQPVKKPTLAYSSSAPAHATTAHVQYTGSVPTGSAPKPKTPFLESKQEQNVPTKPMRWEPQIHYSTTPKMESEAPSTTTWSGSVSGPRRTSVGQEVTITFAPQGFMAKRPSVDIGKPPSFIAPVVEEPVSASTTVEVEKKPVYKEEPTVILRRAAPPPDRPDSKSTIDETDKSEIKRPYSYPGKHSEDDPEITTEMRMKACKTIADLLMFPADKHAKGARMFAKRRKRSERWSVEGMGQNVEEEKDGEEEEEAMDRGVEITLVASGRKPLPPGAVPIGMPLPPPPPPPEPGKPFIPQAPPPPPPGTKYRLKVEPTNFKVNLKKKDVCEHNIVSPEQMGRLVVDLKAASGRGANMFERRRQRSDQYVIDESNVKAPPVMKNTAKPKGIASASITMKQDNQIHFPKKSPWEAAMESPVGSCDAAFEHIQKKRPSLTQVDSSMKGPPPQTKPKPQASRMGHDTLSKAHSDPAQIRPRFTANDPNSAVQLPTGSGSPSFKPKFSARMVSSETSQSGITKSNDFNPKPRGWNSPVHSGETPLASMNSADDGQTTTFSAIRPTRVGSDYNRKPRGWTATGDATANAAANGRPASYNYSKPARFAVHTGRETADL
ncbi:synaptopodin 2-like protein [Acanthaster planci]|uniref:Synaptopodin 2-like protein n=1 Tax=Acanthaster planci TaxID=133434 RepID=A0A8B7XHH2_ACAPL|nr:synaptopodin 2-like protein [Acanthaster planci]